MTQAQRGRCRYQTQRKPKTSPHVPIKYVRLAAKLSIDEVIARIEDRTGRRYTRGAISAIENGHRGASSEVLEALEEAYELPLGAISTDYVPRAPRGRRATEEQVPA
ncbi:helix-turn-helix domain-containing protein [Mycolicibacterium vaccae]|uniref:helix-turn-helix domain-containing protein n=1 Tax=Mycolicibacterium vaccae TaxID=1810 RepID=UPI003CFBF304